MPRNDIGGFFVSLGLNIDKNSFETGNRLIDGVGNSFNKLIGSARNAAVVLAGTAIATGAVESQVGKLAEQIGVSTETLELWKATAKIAGVDANGLVNSMNKVANVLQRMQIDGSGLGDFAKKLGELGIVTADIDIEKLLNLSPDELMKEVYQYAHEALAGGADKTQVQQILKDILGTEGMQLFIDIERRGMTIDQALGEAGNRVYTNSETNANAQVFMTEVRLLKQASENMSQLLGSEVADQLTGYVKSINDWIDEHGDEIAQGIKTVSEGVGKLAGKFVDFVTDPEVQETVKEAVDVLTDSITDTFEGSGKILSGAKDLLTGNFEEGWEKVKEGGKQAAGGTTAPIVKGYQKVTGTDYANDGSDLDNARKIIHDAWLNNPERIVGWITKGNKLEYDTLPPALKALVNNNGGKENFPELKDGIISPDGRIAQVAPDDWVFAARNLGDLARAFVPQNHTAVSGGEYTINQTFNISGGNDMPQVLRQQAYQGTQDAMLQMMEQSARRLQLMSGTR